MKYRKNRKWKIFVLKCFWTVRAICQNGNVPVLEVSVVAVGASVGKRDNGHALVGDHGLEDPQVLTLHCAGGVNYTKRWKGKLEL